MAEDPIRAGQGLYTTSGRKKNVGVCLVIDDQNTWEIKQATDGSTVVIIPAGSKWKVTTEAPTGAKRKVVIFREGGAVRREGPFEKTAEMQINYDGD